MKKFEFGEPMRSEKLNEMVREINILRYAVVYLLISELIIIACLLVMLCAME